MNSILDNLWHEIRGRFEGRLPVWLPNSAMAVGDVGTFETGGWLRRTTLAELGVPFRTTPDQVVGQIEYSSNQGATVSGPMVEFSRAGAVAMWASAARARSIDNVEDVEERVLELYKAGRWRRGWVYVHEVTDGVEVLVVVSGDPGASARVERRTGPRVVHSRNLAASFAAAGPVPVLWRGRFVHDPWFRGSSVRDRGPDSPDGPIEDRPVQVRELDFLDDVSSDE